MINMNKIKNNGIYILFSFLFYLLMILDLKNKLDEYGINSYKYYVLLILVSLIIGIALLVAIKIIFKKNVPEHKLFLIFATILGVFFLFLSPLFTGSDEHNHYYRIYEVTEGKFISEIHKKEEKNVIGSKMPSSLYLTFSDGQKEYVDRNKTIRYYDEKKMIKQKLNSNNKEYYGSVYVKEYNNTALYSPIQYTPEIIGFMIGKILNLGPFFIGYLGRIFNLLFYIGICTYFIKKIPKYKKTALVILLSPTALYSATTLTADGFTIALVFGFISMIMYNLKTEKVLSIKEKILYFILVILIASCKIVYLPMILLLLLLPNKCFKSNKDKYIFMIICMIVSCIVGLLWIKITNRYFEIYYVNTAIQKENILKHPIWYIGVLLRTYMTQFTGLLFNIFGGGDLYHGQLKVYSIISILYIILFSKTYISEKETKNSKKISLFQQLLLVFIILGIITLISTAIYVQCTANTIRIDNPTIGGLQGRYFLPLVIILLLFNKSKIISIKSEDNNLSLMKKVLLINWFIMIQMFTQFII